MPFEFGDIVLVPFPFNEKAVPDQQVVVAIKQCLWIFDAD
jgi:hypothetical protein